jgi:hypothetical protein
LFYGIIIQTKSIILGKRIVVKKILFVLDGTSAKYFLDRVIASNITNHEYHIVYYKDIILPEMKQENFRFYKFDPTSFIKLSSVMNHSFARAVVAMSSKTDTIEVLHHIRFSHKNIPITILDKWNMDIEDKNLIKINSNDILANRLLDTLPDIPVLAQNIGQGKGEIMQILIPFGSSFVYRHISSIEQRDWKIVAVYRNNQLLIPHKFFVIQPNDTIIIIGNPSILKHVYSAVNNEVGQFPSPFGNNIYMFIDMSKESEQSFVEAIKSATYLNDSLKNKKLIIRVINPSQPKQLIFLNKFSSKNILIEVSFEKEDIYERIEEDFIDYNIGLFITTDEIFRQKEFREFIYETPCAVMKLGKKKKLKDINDIVVLLNDNSSYETISPVVFDLSAQLDKNIVLYDLDPENKNRQRVLEHYHNMKEMFSKDIKVISSHANPIRKLKEIDNFLQVIPFTKKVVNTTGFVSLFSTDVEELFHKLSDYNQLFIPVTV